MDYRNLGSSVPRGIRNNNPGNLKADVNWAFMIGEDSAGMTGGGPGFAIFDDVTHGVRALAKDLTTKINKDGLDTIRGIVEKYAPPIQNVTSAYITSVSDDTNIGPDDQLTADGPTIALLVRAIINHENGESASYDYIQDSDIANGISQINLSPGQVFPPGSSTHKPTH